MVRILAIDAGTTGVTCLVFDKDARVIGRGYQEFQQYFPEPGHVEHDPEEIWDATIRARDQALDQANLGLTEITAIGITNQRETTVIWDRGSGRPIHRALVWQDRRTADRCSQLKKLEKSIRLKTGLQLDPYFSATKIEWLLKHVPGADDDAAAGRLAFGTIDTWLLWKLTDGGVHATDVTNASRTMIWDIKEGRWDSELLSVFGIPDALLPDVFPSAHDYGAATAWGGVHVHALAGDQQAALFGQQCTTAGEAKNTYGTGCFLLQHTGSLMVRSKRGLLTTRAASIDEKPRFALEGSVFVGGAAVQWFRDGLDLVSVPAEVDKLAMSVDDAGGVVMVPAFTGLGAPHWDATARGAILGMTRGTTKAHLARALLDGVANQVQDVLDAMEKESAQKIKTLQVDGGMARSDLLLQIQADLMGRPVERGSNVEATATGAALLAGISCGAWNQESLPDPSGGSRFKPKSGRRGGKDARKQWAKAVKAVRTFGN